MSSVFIHHLVTGVLVTGYAFMLAFRRVHASRDIHARLIRSVLHAPITFFHQNPPARMLNRMSRDLEVVDTDIWLSLEVSLDSLCHVLSTCVVIVVAIPYFLLVLLPAAAVYYFVQVRAWRDRMWIKVRCLMRT